MGEPMENQTRIYAYLRVSSRNGNEVSIERQRDAVLTYLKNQNLKGELIFLEEQKVSGGDANRKEYNRLLKLIESGEVQTLVVYSLCRLVRDLELQTRFIKSMIQHKIKFYSITDNINLSNPTPEDLFLANLHGSLNQMYKDKCSQRLKLAWANHRKHGKKTGGRFSPFGFDVGKDKKLIPNPTEQAAIQKMIELKNKGATLREIAEALHRHGIKTKSGSTTWNSKTVKSVLDRHVESRAE